jgi:hypothetical protein
MDGDAPLPHTRAFQEHYLTFIGLHYPEYVDHTIL